MIVTSIRQCFTFCQVKVFALQHEELGEGVDFNAFLLWEKQGEFGGFVCSFVGFAPFPPHFCWFT